MSVYILLNGFIFPMETLIGTWPNTGDLPESLRWCRVSRNYFYQEIAQSKHTKNLCGSETCLQAKKYREKGPHTYLICSYISPKYKKTLYVYINYIRIIPHEVTHFIHLHQHFLSLYKGNDSLGVLKGTIHNNIIIFLDVEIKLILFTKKNHIKYWLI